jgi:5-methyltetrahydropteroyltriglutamate--homocysteine methyltransferase
MADTIEQSSINAISLEDAHRYNDLSLLEHFVTTRVIFGAVAIAKSKVEPVEEIRARLLLALEHIDAERLIAAPDCGLGLLGWTLAREKLNNLCEAARLV